MKVSKRAIFAGIAMVSAAGAVVVTAIMAPKAEAAIKRKMCKEPIIELNGTDITTGYKKADKLELVKTAAPYYIPSALLLILIFGSTLLSQRECKKELLAMSATTAYLLANRDKFKKIAERPEVKEIAANLYPRREEFKHQTIEETGNGDLLCIEEYSGRVFRSSVEAVLEAQRKVNEQYIDEEDNGEFGCAGLGDYHDYLNIMVTQFDVNRGWTNNEDWFYKNEPIGFQNKMIEADAEGNTWGEPYYLLSLDEDWYPIECYLEI